MLDVIGYFEHYRNLRVKKLDAEFRKVMLRIEDESIGSAGQRFSHQEEWLHSAIFIGPGMT